MSAATAPSLITEAMRAAIGSRLDQAVSYPITTSDIRRWVLAVYYPEEPPRDFWDPLAAQATAQGGIVAPEEFNPFAWMNADPPGIKPSYVVGGPTIEAKLGLAELETSYMLNGGVEIHYGVPMSPGDVITSSTVLSDYRERDGRLGRMLFTDSTATWVNQHGAVVKTMTNTLIRY